MAEQSEKELDSVISKIQRKLYTNFLIQKLTTIVIFISLAIFFFLLAEYFDFKPGLNIAVLFLSISFIFLFSIFFPPKHSEHEISAILDQYLQAKERFITHSQLTSGDNAAAKEILGKQISDLKPQEIDPNLIVSLKISRLKKNLIVVLIFLCAALFLKISYQPEREIKNIALVQGLEKTIQKLELPQDLKSELENLSEALSNNDLETPEIQEALKNAEQALTQSVEEQNKNSDQDSQQQEQAEKEQKEEKPQDTKEEKESNKEQDKEEKGKEENSGQKQKDSGNNKGDDETDVQNSKDSKNDSKGTKEQNKDGNSENDSNSKQNNSEGTGDKKQENKDSKDGDGGDGQGKSGQGEGKGDGQNKDGKEGQQKGEASGDGEKNSPSDQSGKTGGEKQSNSAAGSDLSKVKEELEKIKEETQKATEGKNAGKNEGENNKEEKGKDGNNSQGDKNQQDNKKENSSKNKNDSNGTEPKDQNQTNKQDNQGKESQGNPGNKSDEKNNKESKEDPAKQDSAESGSKGMSLPDRNAETKNELPSEEGGGGSKINTSFKETNIESPDDEKLNYEGLSQQGEKAKNRNNANVKTTLQDIIISKPDSVLDKDEQKVPPEYSDLIK